MQKLHSIENGGEVNRNRPASFDTPSQLSPITIFLHWVVGIIAIGLLAVGVYMAETETWSLYPWHKSFGFLLFFIVLFRIAWRIANGWPASVGRRGDAERLLVKTIHTLLLAGVLLMPISGFLMSSLGGSGVEVFGLEVVARNPHPENPQWTQPHNETMAAFFHGLHHWLGYLLICAVLLHIAGALKHHLMDRDGTLRRMLGARV